MKKTSDYSKMYNILHTENTDRRQGDCVLVKIDGFDANLPSRETNILAVGEGHHQHMFPQKLKLHKGKMMSDGEMVNAEFFQVEQDMELVHESVNGEPGEHKSIPLEKGAYAYIKERQYDPFEEQAKTVQD